MLRSSVVTSATGHSASAVKPFFDATSVVVVGASADTSKFAGRVFPLMSALGYRGRLAAINPKYDAIGDVPCYPALEELPEPPELAVVMLPAGRVVSTVADCAELGIGHAVICGKGFAEAGNLALQQELLDTARQGGVRLVGPNCIGTVNFDNGLAASFSGILGSDLVSSGNVSIVAQSGSIGHALSMSLSGRGVGTSKWAGLGNEADLSVLDFAEYLTCDPKTDVVLMYVEAASEVDGWVRVAELARRHDTPVIVYKAGRAASGRSAVASHTGKMAGSYEIWRDVVEATGGITVADTLTEAVDLAYAAAVSRRVVRGGLASLAMGGGVSVITSDEAARHAVPLATLSAETTMALTELLPPGAVVHNPIDTPRPPEEDFYAAAKLLVAEPEVGALLVHASSVVLPYASAEARMAELGAHAATVGKPVAVCYLSSRDRLDAAVEHRLVRDHRIAFFADPAQAVGCLGSRFAQHTPAVASADRDHISASAERRAALGWAELGADLAERGVPMVKTRTARSADEAADACSAWGVVVLKLDDPGQPHKTEAGLVRLGIGEPDLARATWTELTGLATSPDAEVIVQEQAPEGAEVVVACLRDPEIGPVVGVGWGGTITELLRDVTFDRCPVDPEAAKALVDRTLVSRILHGYRGGPPLAVDALVRCIVSLSEAFSARVDLVELELNPVVVTPTRAVAVDVLAFAGSEGNVP